MNCPACNVTLTMTERQNVEIDYCPKCRGVWLDRGELDKIVERSAGGSPGRAPETPDPDDEHGQGPGRRRRGFLADLLDFD